MNNYDTYKLQQIEKTINIIEIDVIEIKKQMKTIISLLSNPKGSLTRYKCSECGNWWNPDNNIDCPNCRKERNKNE